jgi:hypothetical protein
MADNYRIQGTGAIAFGTEDVGYEDVGVVQSASDNLTGDKLELKNRKGNVFLVVYFNDQNQCQLKAIFDTTFELPARGDSISLMGLANVLVDDVEKNYENEKEAGLTIKATRYEALVID